MWTGERPFPSREVHADLGAVLFTDQQITGAFLRSVGEDDIRTRRGPATRGGLGDVIGIIMAMAGGWPPAPLSP